MKSLIFLLIAITSIFMVQFSIVNAESKYSKPIEIEMGLSSDQIVIHMIREVSDIEKKELKEIYGVENVFSTSKYTLEIHKGKLFKWPIIISEVMTIFLKYD